jgi:hypothetical protein
MCTRKGELFRNIAPYFIFDQWNKKYLPIIKPAI